MIINTLDLVCIKKWNKMLDFQVFSAQYANQSVYFL